MRVAFGQFTFDSDQRVLTRGVEPVVLSPKAFALLEMLIEARPAAVAREALYDRLWPRTFVEAGNMHNLVSEIRTAIGDGDRSVIRTVRGYGYAFAAQPPRAAEPSRFGVLLGGKPVRLREGENLIGRDPDAAVFIDSPDVSRQHARLVVADDAVMIEDLGSKNGTSVDDEPVRQREIVPVGAKITVGRTILVLQAIDSLGSTLTAS